MATCVVCHDPINTVGQDWCDSCSALKIYAERLLKNKENPTALNKTEREKVQEIVDAIKQEIKRIELRNEIPISKKFR